MWSVTDPELAGTPGWANTHGEVALRDEAMAALITRWRQIKRDSGRLASWCREP